MEASKPSRVPFYRVEPAVLAALRAQAALVAAEPQPVVARTPAQAHAAAACEAGLRCSTCRLEFPSLERQRSHFRGELHKSNLGRAHDGMSPINAAELKEARLARRLARRRRSEGSGGGSASSSDGGDTTDEESSGSPSSASEADEDAGRAAAELTGPFVHATTPEFVVSMWRAVAARTPVKRARDMMAGEVVQDVLSVLQSGRVWAVVLLRSGHFAGASRAARHAPSASRSAHACTTAAVFDRGEVLAHKTIHRYTTRRKQGGAQSKKDNSGSGKAR